MSSVPRVARLRCLWLLVSLGRGVLKLHNSYRLRVVRNDIWFVFTLASQRSATGPPLYLIYPLCSTLLVYLPAELKSNKHFTILTEFPNIHLKQTKKENAKNIIVLSFKKCLALTV